MDTEEQKCSSNVLSFVKQTNMLFRYIVLNINSWSAEFCSASALERRSVRVSDTD